MLRKSTKPRLLLAAYALSGVAALIYELGWMRELSAMLGATAYASGTMLGAYMTGLGFGALAGVWVSKRTSNALRAACRTELAIAALSIVAFLGIRYLPGLYFDWMRAAGTGSASTFLTLQFAVSFLIMVLPTFAMGMTYPLIMRAVGRDSNIGALSGKLYSVNTMGAIIGSLAATFAFLPTVGVKGSLVAAAAISVLSAWLFCSIANHEKQDERNNAGARGAQRIQNNRGVDFLTFVRSPEIIVAAIVIAGIALIPARAESPLGLGQAFYYDSAREFNEASSERTVLYDKEGIYSRVQVIQNPDGTKTLCNGALDEGTNNNYDRVTTAMIAAVPAASVEASTSALVVGLGTGYTSQTYYDLGFQKTTTVEINPEVLPASEHFLETDFSDSSRWETVIDDARAYILTSPATYDCISSEPSWPWSSGVAALFTEEFIAAARTRLNANGAYCQWLPNYLLNLEDVAMMYKTMSQVFDRVDVWVINFPDTKANELLLVGMNNPGAKSQSVIKAQLDALIESGQFDNDYIVPECITPYDKDRVATLNAGLNDPSVPLNTDNHSTLEYRVFWNYITRAFEPKVSGWGTDLE